MRIKNSFAAAVAAAVAAVVFSAAFQPADAATIVIDSFTTPMSPNPAAGSTSAVAPNFSTVVQAMGIPSGTVYDSVSAATGFEQDAGTGRQAATFSGTFSTTAGGGGSLLWNTGKTALTAGTAYDTVSTVSSLSYQNGSLSGFDWTSFSNNKIRITKSSGSRSSSIPIYVNVYVTDTDENVSFYTVPEAQWFSATTLEIPYASFTPQATPADFTKVRYLDISQAWSPEDAGERATGMSSSVTLTEIALVPEPTQMVSVAAGGAAYGAWRLRKRRARRAGDAGAG